MKKLFILLFTCLALTGSAQQTTLYNALGTNLLTDTVTNSGTGYVQIKTSTPLSAKLSTTSSFWVTVTKLSGTVGGTMTLMGSFDGSNYKAIPTVGTQTSVTTITPADASGYYTWIISGNPYPYYRVSWTGTGTMSATLAAKVLRN